MKNFKYVITLVTAIILIACNNDTNTPQKTESAKVEIIQTPKFNPDSVFYFIQKQVDFGPRTPNSKAHKACSEWLINYFKTLGWQVEEQRGVQMAHDGEALVFVNIIAKFQPEKTQRIQLSAHWDTRPWADQDSENQNKPIDGANDGASGVGVIMEIARLISQENLEIGIDVVLFDVEDYGISEVENSFCYGSQYWFKNFNAIHIIPKFGINLDMVGDKNAQYFYEGYSMEFARPVLDKVWRAASDLGYSSTFISTPSGYITDDHYWVNKTGIPCIDIIHKDPETKSFPKSWHTHDDNINNIDKTMLNIVGNTLIQVIYRENKNLQAI
jgi:hypothetical protein